MFPSSRRPQAGFWLFFIGWLLLDQLTKQWAQRHLAPVNTIEIIPGFFSLTYVRNTGVAFGLLAGHNILLGLMAVVLIALAIYWARLLDWYQREVQWTAAALLAGAIGNLLDRLRHGYVVDFLDFYVGARHWPAFNVADSCICIAVTWIFLRQLGLFSARNSH